MKLNKSQSLFLKNMIDKWQKDQLLSSEKANELKSNISISGFDWKKLASYAFGIAISCIAISLLLLVSDADLQSLITKLGRTPNHIFFSFFSIISIVLYYLGIKRQRTKSQFQFSNEALLFGGVLSTAGAIIFFGKMMDNGSQHFSILLLISTIIYLVLGWLVKSKQIWIFGLISLAGWFGTETAYQTDWSNYFMGMNYPLRFMFFGAILFTVFQFLKHIKSFEIFYNVSTSIALLYLFCSLWLLSIFGNYGDIDSWYSSDASEHVLWMLILAFIAGGFLFHGLKYGYDKHREFGIFFIIINIYSRYFEFFWAPMHKTIFFAILAISFWFIGKRAERFWLKKSKSIN